MSSGSDARVGVRAGQRERCEQRAKSNRGERPPRCFPHVLLRDGEAAPRGRDSGRERVVSVLSSNGRPGTRQGIRTPHPGAALPVDAYSLAVACGSRGVSPDIWPASLSAPAVPRVARLPDTTGTAPRPARHVAPRPDYRHAGRLPGRHGLSAPRRSSWPLWYAFVRTLPRIWRTVPLRCVDRLSCSFAARHWVSTRCCHHTPGSSSRQRRLWRPVIAGHLSTASSRRHQQSS